MECPYCKKQMQSGTIDVYDTLSWSPGGGKRRGSTKVFYSKTRRFTS